MLRAALPDFSARQLEAVLALVEYGSFVAAAARLRISQPALTRAVKRLERELGVRLFDRTTRRVQVTAAGREFAAVAERMLADLGITVQSVREVAEERRGLVVLSSVMSVAGAFLPRLIAAYRADRPGVEIHVRESVHGSVMEDVRAARGGAGRPQPARGAARAAPGAAHRRDRAARTRTDAGRGRLPGVAAARVAAAALMRRLQ